MTGEHPRADGTGRAPTHVGACTSASRLAGRDADWRLKYALAAVGAVATDGDLRELLALVDRMRKGDA